MDPRAPGAGPPPSRPGPFPEFEDEEPGSYLSELGTRPASIVWGAVNLAGILILGILGAAGRIPVASDWRLVAEVIWALLPLSAAVLLITTLWQAGTGYTRTAPGRARVSLILAAAGLGFWLLFRLGWGVLGG